DVIFADLPPGLLGQGAPMVADGTTTIVRGTLILSSNTGKGPGPSYGAEFFTTAVHEVGHALGWQHTWTGSAMSQDVIRHTSSARRYSFGRLRAATPSGSERDGISRHRSVRHDLLPGHHQPAIRHYLPDQPRNVSQRQFFGESSSRRAHV